MYANTPFEFQSKMFKGFECLAYKIARYLRSLPIKTHTFYQRIKIRLVFASCERFLHKKIRACLAPEMKIAKTGRRMEPPMFKCRSPAFFGTQLIIIYNPGHKTWTSSIQIECATVPYSFWVRNGIWKYGNAFLRTTMLHCSRSRGWVLEDAVWLETACMVIS